MLRPQDFEYELPDELIAQSPKYPRSSSRLLHLRRGDGSVSDLQFESITELILPGDLLVLNDTRVIPAKFQAWRSTGGRVDGLYLSSEENGNWEVLLRNAGRCHVGEMLGLSDGSRLEILERREAGHWRVRPEPLRSADAVLGSIGSTPLPPYIRRPKGQEDERDRQSYQTVYASRPGAVAAPTAGLHFTQELLDRLESGGVELARVTLHVGLGTFLPVKAREVSAHRMHSEWFELPAATAEALGRTRQRGGRIVAVGTTVVRVLESAARGRQGQAGATDPSQARACSGWTDIFLYPPAEFHWTDALVTNFHLPASTLVMLVAAFCDPGGVGGRGMILGTYRHAVENRYRFFSFGDAMFIE